MNSSSKTVFVRVVGRVQGVGFRAWTQSEARRLGLRGWVRNERDGSVRALIAGSREAVAEMLEVFLQGPLGAKVRSVETEPANLSDTPVGFDITG